MTDEQKKDIISTYNIAVMAAERGLSLMDSNNEKTAARGRSDHSFSMGKQDGIDMVLELLGYVLVLDDCDFAIDIIKEDIAKEGR